MAQGCQRHLWVRVHVLSPNDMTPNQANFTLVCGSCSTGFAVTSASATTGTLVVTRTYPNCDVNFTGTITVNGPGSATYCWERDNGELSPMITLASTGADTIHVNHTFHNTKSGTLGARIHVLTPNEVYSNYQYVSIICTGSP